MVEIYPLRDKEKLSELYNDLHIPFNDRSIAIIARDSDEILGKCLFDMFDEYIVIHTIIPDDDPYFADGLLRSAIHVGVENGKIKAYYSENAREKLFESLKFIKNAETRELDVNKLFSSCKNCSSD